MNIRFGYFIFYIKKNDSRLIAPLSHYSPRYLRHN